MEGQDLTALCGQIVPKAKFVYFFDMEFSARFLGSLSSINHCKACYRPYLGNGRYLYGIVPGEQALHMETGESL